MERTVVISKTAEKKLEKLFEYLVQKWSLKVKRDFIKKLDRNIELIKKSPESFPQSEKKTGLHRCVITKHSALYFKYNDRNIFIVTIFDTRQNPKKLNKEL